MLGVRVERMYPHARDAFTEGLLYRDGRLYESTGPLGFSSLRRVNLETGNVELAIALGADVLGEGLAQVGATLVQLSFQNGRALLWNQESFVAEGEFHYEGEGWGLCHDGRRFVMSDGTDVLQLRDEQTFEQVGSLSVDLSRVGRPRLNELECVGGQIYGNLLEQRQIARIDGATGVVTGWIDTGTLLLRDGVGDTAGAAELNGIAYIPDRDHFLLTGKNWPWVFEVAIVPRAESDAMAP